MRYPVYKKYQPSKLDYNISIPHDWQEKRLKFVASHNDETLSEKTEPDYEIKYVDISSVDLINGITKTETFSFEKAPSRARRVVKDGDSIVSTVRTYLKAIAAIRRPPENMVVSTGFAVIRPEEEIHSNYLSYFLQSQGFVDSVVANSVGVSYPAINASDLVCLPVSYPTSIKEQKQIADFLDYKTQQIDQLIQKKKALIEKLNEQRIAVITQAVTKGLDKNAKMKPSGMDWLGEVPAHWGLKRFKFSVNLRNTKIDAKDTDLAYMGMENVESFTAKKIYDEENPPLSDGVGSYFKKNDVLFGKLRPYLAKAYLCDDKGFCSSEFLVFEAKEYEPEYLVNLVLSDWFIRMVNSSTYGAKMPRANWEFIANLQCPVPDIQEQKNIVSFIQEEIKKVEKLRSAAARVIERLEEYRSAIITDAVTGKIDVRNIEIGEVA